LRVVSSGDYNQLQVFSTRSNVKAGQSYVLSAWLKSNQSAMAVPMQISAPGLNVNQTFTVDGTWRRYSLGGVAASNSTQASCLIYPSGSGTLWIDDVQFEAGEAASDFQPSPMDETIITQTVHRAASAISDYPCTPGGSSVTVSLDSARRFLVDGQPFVPFALGWNSSSTYRPSLAILQEIARAGFNTLCLSAKSDTPAHLRTILDDARTCGLKVIFWADRSVSTAMLGDWVTSLKDHSAIIVWYVYDEPTTPAQWNEAQLKYQTAKTNDPTRPSFVNFASMQLPTGWTGDILSTDDYPVPTQRPVVLANLTDKMENLAAPVQKPVWMWQQSSGYAYYLGREPTGPEAECMAYLSMIHGARGFMYFFWKPRSAELWSEMRSLADEISTLTPVLSSTDTTPTVSASSPCIHLLSKSCGGTRYLIAVNESPLPVTATLTSSEAGSESATALFENRNVNVVNGQITDTFAGYQRHVYSFSEPLVAHWKLDETSGEAATDSSGSLNTGTLINGPTWATGGKVFGCLNFDGVNDYVSVANSASLNPTTQISICFWLKAPSVSVYGMMVSKNYRYQYAVMWDGWSTRIRFDLRPWFLNQFVSASALSLNEWHHVACTFDGHNARIYLDGILDKVSSTVSGTISATTDALNIGNNNSVGGGNYPYKGEIDEVRVYRHALTPSEIAALAAAP
jgi:hypothetical protein